MKKIAFPSLIYFTNRDAVRASTRLILISNQAFANLGVVMRGLASMTQYFTVQPASKCTNADRLCHSPRTSSMMRGNR
jgi:hypothetical protein